MEKRSASQVIEDLKNIPYEVSFSRESVIEILENIECPEQQKPQGKIDYDIIHDILLKEVSERVVDAIENLDINELIENPNFKLSGNEIELDSVDINTRLVKDYVRDVLNEYIEELKQEQEDDE